MSEGKVSFKEKLNALGETELTITSVPVIKDIDLLRRVSAESSIETAERIWPVLKESLDPKAGYGLSAIQIGVPQKIAFVRYANKEYFLLNTRIVEKSGEFIMPGEACLSIPGRYANTIRYRHIVVEDDVLGRLELNESSDGLLPIIFQHEVDHFEGITILDRQQPPRVVLKKIGRNQPCPCGSGLKYKKCCGKDW